MGGPKTKGTTTGQCKYMYYIGYIYQYICIYIYIYFMLDYISYLGSNNTDILIFKKIRKIIKQNG